MNYSILSEDVTVGERVRYFRQKRNLTQAQLAKWVGCSVGLISRLEHHNSLPSADILLSICRELRVPPIYVFKNSQHISVMFMCIPGKTVFLDSDNMIDFELVSFSTDIEVDKNMSFCVLFNDKIYLADKSMLENCDLYLFCNKSTGESYVLSSSETDSVPADSVLVAGLVIDITDLCSYVMM